MSLTVVSEQGLGRTLRVWAGGLRAAPTGETNATVGTAVTLTPHCHVASIYTPLPPQKHAIFISSLSHCFWHHNRLIIYQYITAMIWALLFQSVHQWTPTVLSLEQYSALHLRAGNNTTLIQNNIKDSHTVQKRLKSEVLHMWKS